MSGGLFGTASNPPVQQKLGDNDVISGRGLNWRPDAQRLFLQTLTVFQLLERPERN